MKSFFFLIYVISSTSRAALLPDEQNNVEVYQKTSPAVVNITAVTLHQDFFFQVIPQKGVGSGAIIRPEGYILTNDHVVGSAQNVEVTLADKTTYPAKVIGTDPDTDTAILKIDAKGKKLSYLEVPAKEELLVGQKVLAIGNPFGLGGSLSVGIISSLSRDIRAMSGRTIKDVIQTDAAINPGNSGGPLLNSAGRLIGINTQIVSASGGSHGVGFAISASKLKKIVDQLIQYGEVLRPTLGIIDGFDLHPDLLEHWRMPSDHGVMLVNTYEGSPVDKAGLKGADRERKLIIGRRLFPFGGDIIHQLDDTKVATMREILDYVGEKKTGETVVVHYLRGGKKKTASVKLSLPPHVRGKSL